MVFDSLNAPQTEIAPCTCLHQQRGMWANNDERVLAASPLKLSQRSKAEGQTMPQWGDTITPILPVQISLQPTPLTFLKRDHCHHTLREGGNTLLFS